MKDRQAPQTVTQPRIPLISALVHCLSMPVTVYLRSGFGYAYLRPRSIFIAFTWAMLLFALYARIEPGAWEQHAAFCLFGIGAACLYFTHLLVAFVSELRGNATHDHDSGVPHLIRLLRLTGSIPHPRFRSLWVIWVEPALVALAALAAYLGFHSSGLSALLLLSAGSLWIKEALNFWLQLRQRKRQRDAMEDAEDSFDGSHTQTEIAPPSPSRKGKVTRQRAS